MDPTGVPNRQNPVVSYTGDVIPFELVVDYCFMVRARLSAIDGSRDNASSIARGEDSCFHWVDEASA